MRLSQELVKMFKEVIYSIDRNATILLFGSRTNDNKTGGDIDLLIISDKISFNDKLKIRKEFFKNVEEQKIDLCIRKNLSDPFVQLVLKNAIKL